MRFSPTVYKTACNLMEVAMRFLRQNFLAQDKGVEPLSNGSQPLTLSIELILYMVYPSGFEPLTDCLEGSCCCPTELRVYLFIFVSFNPFCYQKNQRTNFYNH